MSVTTEDQILIQNHILASLSAEEYERLLPHLEQVELRLGEILSRPDEPIEYAYFPQSGTISVIVLMEDGAQVEVGIVGNEGMFGLPIVLGTTSAPLQSLVQIAGQALRMKASVLREKAENGGQLHQLLLCYTQAFFIQTAITAACNRVHHLDGRLARWLLMCQDRAQTDELQLTHEFIATMLGVRRAGVSVAANKLQAAGLISYTRGDIHILDRAGLEAYSCECYGVVRRELARLLAAC